MLQLTLVDYSPKAARPGDTITVIYNLKNTGGSPECYSVSVWWRQDKVSYDTNGTILAGQTFRNQKISFRMPDKPEDPTRFALCVFRGTGVEGVGKPPYCHEFNPAPDDFKVFSVDKIEACTTGCEVSCQTACERSCQRACMLECQTACERTCQGGCETACQTGCEVSCQTECERACQTCEAGCQTDCQARIAGQISDSRIRELYNLAFDRRYTIVKICYNDDCSSYAVYNLFPERQGEVIRFCGDVEYDVYKLFRLPEIYSERECGQYFKNRFLSDESYRQRYWSDPDAVRDELRREFKDSLIAEAKQIVQAGGYCNLYCETYNEHCIEPCQLECQAGCETACETACEKSCQTGCEVTCEVSCQKTCQTSCEKTCETACETICQTGCEVTCETECEKSYQVECETICQTACEKSCQTGCEVTCEVSCERTCEVACETETQPAPCEEATEVSPCSTEEEVAKMSIFDQIVSLVAELFNVPEDKARQYVIAGIAAVGLLFIFKLVKG